MWGEVVVMKTKRWRGVVTFKPLTKESLMRLKRMTRQFIGESGTPVISSRSELDARTHTKNKKGHVVGNGMLVALTRSWQSTTKELGGNIHRIKGRGLKIRGEETSRRSPDGIGGEEKA